MVHYIRFLKQPLIQQSGAETRAAALVTLTTDLGDDFFHHEVSLFAAIIEQDGHQWKEFLWRPHMRTLWIEFRIADVFQTSRTMTLVVSPLRDIQGDELRVDKMPEILGARCPLVRLGGTFVADKVQRQLRTEQAQIDVYEDMGESIARHIWDAGCALIAYLDQLLTDELNDDETGLETASALTRHLRSARLNGCRLLELGAGCGLVGMWMASALPHCYIRLTDLPEAMALLESNVAQGRYASESRTDTSLLDWSEEIPQDLQSQKYDLILVSDCTYNCDSIPMLVSKLEALLNISPQALVVVSMKSRHDSEAIFFDLMAKAGTRQLEKQEVMLPSRSQMALGQSGETAEIFVFGKAGFPTKVNTLDVTSMRI